MQQLILVMRVEYDDIADEVAESTAIIAFPATLEGELEANRTVQDLGAVFHYAIPVDYDDRCLAPSSRHATH